MIHRRNIAGFGKIDEETTKPRMVCAARQDGFHVSELDQESGLAARPVQWTPGNRDLQYVVRADAVQRAFSRNRGLGEEGCVGGRRISAGVPGDVAGRSAAAAN